MLLYMTFVSCSLKSGRDRFRLKLAKQRTRTKIQLTSYVVQTFPDLQYFFKFGLHQKAVYAILKEPPSASQIASMHLTHLKYLLTSNFLGRFKKESALELRVLAQKSVENSDKSLYVQITQSIAQIELLDRQIHTVDAEVRDIVESLDSVIMTIPGIGPINGGMIPDEIGDNSRFSKPHKLLTLQVLLHPVTNPVIFLQRKSGCPIVIQVHSDTPL